MVTKPESVTPPSGAVCANCGAPLYGEYCYQCGQPVKGLIRHLSGVLGDVFDTLLNIDSRVVRTLPALYFRPGFLTREYFAGRRVRYVTPFRLMFFLCLAAFFVMQLAFDNATSNFGSSRNSGTSFDSAHTPAQVRADEQKALAEIDRAASKPELPATARAALIAAKQRVQSEAADRLVEMKREGAPAAGGSTPAVSGSIGLTDDEARHSTDLNFPGGDTWELTRNPVHIGWLPGFVNDWINQAGQNMHDNVLALKNSRSRKAAIQRMFAGLFSLLPQTMFVLLPLFAVILKVFYIFKRRLYMEHLIVALHSHAFIFLSLLVLFALSALSSLAPTAWLKAPLALLSAAAWIWLFVYLYLMQKRVYTQGWFFTTTKYLCVGICYTLLLSVAIACAFVLSMARA